MNQRKLVLLLTGILIVVFAVLGLAVNIYLEMK
jgi:hypothetical protein